MRTPQLLAVIALCLGLALVAHPTMAQDGDRSAAEQRLEQGLEQFEAGNLQQAHEILRAIDYTHLPFEQRIVLFETIEELEQQVNGAPITEPDDDAEPGLTPEQLIDRADAVAADHPGEAAGLYNQVLSDADADPQTRARAGARLAQLRRAGDVDLTQARQLIDRAHAELRAGNHQAALRHARAAHDAEVNLGWFDQQRLDQILAAARERADDEPVTIAERPVDDEPTPEPVDDEPTITEPAPPVDDIMSRARRLRAQQRLAEGRDAEGQGQIELAIRHYQQAAQLDPELDEARDRLAAVRGRRDARPADREMIQDHLGREQLREQDALARFDREMARARQQLAVANYPQAQDAVSEARRTLDHHRRVLRPEQYRTLRHEAEQLAVQIDERRARAEAQDQRRREVAQRHQQELARHRAEREQHQQIREFLERALALRMDMRYEEALALVDRALAIDPNDPAAQAMQISLKDTWQMVRHRDYMQERARESAELTVQVQEASIPYSDLITYPPDWPELSLRRWRGLMEEHGMAVQTRRALSQAIPVDFPNTELAEALDHLREATDVDFNITWPALEQAGIHRDTLIDLRLREIEARRALEMVLHQASTNSFDGQAAYAIQDGFVAISTEQDLQRSVDVRVYDIRDLLVEVPNFDDPPTFSLQEVLQRRREQPSSGPGFGVGGSGAAGSATPGSDRSSQRGPVFQNNNPAGSREQYSRELLVEQITSLIRDTVGRQNEWAFYGADGAVSSMRELNGNLIVRTNPTNHSAIGSLLEQLRETRMIQISVEARFLLVDQHFLEDIGIDLDFQIVNLGGNFGPIRVAQDSVNIADAAHAGSLMTPAHFLDRPAGTTAGPGDFSPGAGFTPRTGRSMDIGASFLDDLQVNLLVRATQASQRSISLTAPRVTFLDGQRAYVVVAREVAYISDLEAVPDAISLQPDVDVVQSGVVLDVEATVSADRRYVTMTLRPTLATLIEPMRSVRFAAIVSVPTGDGDEQIIPIEGFIDLPEIELTTVRTTVHVPDKGTLLIGGQRLLAETEIEAGVPVLSRLPLLNRLFTNQTVVQDERTLLILVKPTIIIPREEEDLLFPGLLQNPEAYDRRAPGF